MPDYCVNKLALPNGQHEVHHYDCRHLPPESSQHYLGMFSNCRDAVRIARRVYPNANGCYHCARDCHFELAESWSMGRSDAMNI